MSITQISDKNKLALWGKSGGRCEYEGCNKPLWIDSLTKAEFNTAYVAHIIADKPDGPRGDPVLSGLLKDDISNLMLMCDEHHRLIDRADIKSHPTEKLQEMKRKHEERIEQLTALIPNQRSHVILYGANIGQHQIPLNWGNAVQAMLPNWYPACKPPMEIGLKNSSFQDNEPSFWQIEREHLQRQFSQIVKPMLNAGNINHISVFALAPQPLLIELGHLLSDIPATETYQLHREPPNWKWQENPDDFEYIFKEPDSPGKTIAVNLSLSATIDNSRIFAALGKDTSVWTLTIEYPYVDFLKSRGQLSQFRQIFRKALNKIKATHGESTVLHIFPAVPVSVAVDIGRVWMPKADLPLRIYDQNRKIDGFSVAFDIIN